MDAEQQAICKAIDQRNADESVVNAAQLHYSACSMGMPARWTGELAPSLRRVKVVMVHGPLVGGPVTVTNETFQRYRD